jgi:hypothetical protein
MYQRATICELAAMYDLPFGTIQAILTDNLGLVMKSARWVPKLLSVAQKQEQVDCSRDFLKLLRWHSLAVLNNMVTMDESAVSFHAPETKKQSMQWVKKGQPVPRKAQVHATRSKQMVLIFIYAKGVIYTNYVPSGETVNTEYIRKALAAFLKAFRKKGPITSSQD